MMQIDGGGNLDNLRPQPEIRDIARQSNLNHFFTHLGLNFNRQYDGAWL